MASQAVQNGARQASVIKWSRGRDLPSMPDVNVLVVGDVDSVDVREKDIDVVSSRWVVESLQAKRVISRDAYKIKLVQGDRDGLTQDARAEEKVKGDESRRNNMSSSRGDETIAVRRGYAFMQDSDTINLNWHITRVLDELQNIYSALGDTWRVYAYRKASDIFKRLKKEIRSEDDVRMLESADIKGLGDKMIEKVKEIMEQGSLEKLENFKNDERVQSLHRFSQIWGVGPTTAQKWYKLGYRTFADLENANVLNAQQKVGLKYFEEFLKRIPRSEVHDIEDVVRNEVENFVKESGYCTTKLKVITCGSYRRMLDTCGDVDILITHESEDVLDGLLLQVIERLEKIGFLSDHLSLPSKTKSVHENAEATWSSSYMGVCLLSKVS
jgi:DNA polymerase/3'-5' exonuclease PolX